MSIRPVSPFETPEYDGAELPKDKGCRIFWRLCLFTSLVFPLVDSGVFWAIWARENYEYLGWHDGRIERSDHLQSHEQVYFLLSGFFTGLFSTIVSNILLFYSELHRRFSNLVAVMISFAVTILFNCMFGYVGLGVAMLFAPMFGSGLTR